MDDDAMATRVVRKARHQDRSGMKAYMNRVTLTEEEAAESGLTKEQKRDERAANLARYIKLAKKGLPLFPKKKP